MADMNAIRHPMVYTELRVKLIEEEQEAGDKGIDLDLLGHFGSLVDEVNSYLNKLPAPPVEYRIFKSNKGALIPLTIINKFTAYMKELNYYPATGKYTDHYIFKYQRPSAKQDPPIQERVYTYIIGERVIETHLSPKELKLIRDATSYWFSDYTDEDLIGYLKEFDYCITETAITKELP